MSTVDPLKTTAETLRWSERYTKTDMVYLIQGGFWLYLGQAVNMLVSLGSAIAFANLLSPELYGNYKYILSVVGVIGTLTLTGLTTAVTRSVARGYEGVLQKSFVLTLQWSLAMVIVAALGGTYYLFNNNATLGISLFIAGALTPLISGASLYRPFLSGQKSFRLMSILGVAQNALPVLVVIGTLLLTHNVTILVASYFISQTIVVYWLYRYTLRVAVHNSETDDVFAHLGKHLSIMNIIGTVAARLDSILIFQLLGGTELAIFTFATAIPDQLRASFKNIATLAVPKFAGKSKEELKQTVFNKSFIIFGICAAVTLVYVLASPLVFSTFFPLYTHSVFYSQVYAVTIMTALVLSGSYFDAQVAVKERYFLSFSSAIAMIVCTCIGIYFFGLWGAIGARIVSRLIIVGLSTTTIIRH